MDHKKRNYCVLALLGVCGSTFGAMILCVSLTIVFSSSGGEWKFGGSVMPLLYSALASACACFLSLMAIAILLQRTQEAPRRNDKLANGNSADDG